MREGEAAFVRCRVMEASLWLSALINKLDCCIELMR